MDYLQARECMAAGVRVRRASWPKNLGGALLPPVSVVQVLYSEQPNDNSPTQDLCFLSQEDTDAEDWEIVA